ncbi:MAG TPA: type VII secretion protein EccB, partial [Mycobacterium sp.]
KTLEPLNLDPGSAVQAPWPIVRTVAAGPAISHDSALLARDTLTGGGAVAPVPEANPQAGG